MREILFRGKHSVNGKWIYGMLARTGSGVSNMVDCHEMLVPVLSETVGQYTGLTDRNGKKIFEGDIVDCRESWWDARGPAGHDSPILQVEFDEGTCGFIPFSDYDCDCGVYIYSSEVVVIGNIHDNPELLGGGRDV